MTDDKKPTAPARTEPRLMRLASIRFQSALTLHGVSPIQGIMIGGKDGWPAENVVLTATSVWLLPVGGSLAMEIARSSCVFRWEIGDVPLAVAVTALQKASE